MPIEQTDLPPEAVAETPSALDLAKLRHDLLNAIGHVLGFAEILLEQVQEQPGNRLGVELEVIQQTASRMIARINDGLDAAKAELIPAHLDAVCEEAARIVHCAEGLDPAALEQAGASFKSDVSRIIGAARQVRQLARTSLGCSSRRKEAPSKSSAQDQSLLTSAPASSLDSSRHKEAPSEFASDDQGFLVSVAPGNPHEGVILVVDDLEENRELLSRRLGRLGYSVRTAQDGQRALDAIAIGPVDLILLDIIMPGLDGFEVLQRLKQEPATQHIPIIMLSSADQIEIAVRCIKLGADDFLPKPFNPTLLMARIESSLSKKRLRDKEAAFLKRLQIEQDTSERLLLNILPRPIAGRLKQGEKNIADSFAEATVLFSDFVNFTRLSAGIAPKVLVGNLNEIFSAFDQLCEDHCVEKIKMIGDGYMAVAGVPTPSASHARAAAQLALAMQAEAARFASRSGQPFRMRIGLNTGPLVAGVIGTRKFAYDLWGDTVNVAKHMESHAPPGGILVTAATYQSLCDVFPFQVGRSIPVKGKGEVMTYLLLPNRAHVA
jgi:class 3 adenylate cyclase